MHFTGFPRTIVAVDMGMSRRPRRSESIHLIYNVGCRQRHSAGLSYPMNSNFVEARVGRGTCGDQDRAPFTRFLNMLSSAAVRADERAVCSNVDPTRFADGCRLAATA